MMSTRYKSNDLDLYNREGKSWWQPGSPLHVLESMNPTRFEFFDRFVKDWRGLHVLDVGCGGGFTCEFVAKRGARVSGVDLSPVSIETAAEHARANGLEIAYQVSSAENLPFKQEQFDVVVCVDVLEHVSDLRRTLAEIQRVLKPGGIFLFDTINKTFKSKLIMIWLLERLLKQIPKGTHDWKLFIPPQRLIEAFGSVGFAEPALAGFEVKGIDKSTGKIIARIGEDMSVMYIGKTEKRALL